MPAKAEKRLVRSRSPSDGSERVDRAEACPDAAAGHRPVRALPAPRRAARALRHDHLGAGHRGAAAHQMGLRPRALPRRRAEARHPPAGDPGGRDGGPHAAGRPVRDRHHLPLQRDRPAGHAGHARPPLRASADHVAALLHHHPHRGDPVADLQRRGRRADRGDAGLLHDPLGLRPGGDHAGGDGGPVLAADPHLGGRGPALRLLQPPDRADPPPDPVRRPARDGRHEREDRGDPLGVRRPALQGLPPPARRRGLLPGRQPPPRRAARPPADGGPHVPGAGPELLRDHPGGRLPGGRILAEQRVGRRDHRGHARRLHRAPEQALRPLPRGPGDLPGDPGLDGALRAHLPVPRPAPGPGGLAARAGPGAGQRARARRLPRRPLPLRGGHRLRGGRPQRRLDAGSHRPRDPARAARGARGPQRRRQDDADLPAGAPLRRRRTAR